MATVNEILVRVRRKIGDMQKIKFSDDELIAALNDSIDAISGELIIALEPEMIKTLTITGQTAVNRPTDYIKFVGQYPIQFITDNSSNVTFKHLDPDFAGSLSVRYFSTKPKVAAVTDTIPFEKLIHQTMLVDRTASAFVPAPTPEK